MPCFSPLPAFYSGKMTAAGKFDIVVLPRTELNLLRHSMRLPCGRCSHCRLKRSREWAIRCVHEAKLYEPTFDNPHARGSCFITLTYNNDHLPEHGTLVKKHFQDFLKRLRKRYVPVCPFKKKLSPDEHAAWMQQFGIRYYMCGEYGGKYGRPHFHAILFNWNFDFDKYFWEKSETGFDLYRSPSLESLWTDDKGSIGYSSVAEFSFDTAAYVARYVMKKVTGDHALLAYAVIDDDTGELLADKLPEYNDMSRRPGIASHWFDEYGSDVYPRDSVVIKGREMPPPKFYDRRYELVYPEDMARIKEERSIAALANKVSEERLTAMRKCKERQVERLVRKLDDKEL